MTREEWKTRQERKERVFRLDSNILEWYETFRPIERFLFIHSFWTIGQFLNQGDCVHYIMTILITLWKRLHFSSIIGVRNYPKKDTPPWFYNELERDGELYYLESIEESRLQLANHSSYDEDYLEILRGFNDDIHLYRPWTIPYTKEFKPPIGGSIYRETIRIPFNDHYECIDIRDREKLQECLTISNLDKFYDAQLLSIGRKKRYGKLYDLVLKLESVSILFLFHLFIGLFFLLNFFLIDHLFVMGKKVFLFI